MHLHTSARRLLLLTVLAVFLGFAGGAAAWALFHLIGLITNLALFHRVAWEIPSFDELTAGPRILLVAGAGAFIVSLLAKWSPVIRGHGIPEAMESILTKQSRIAPRAAVAKPLSAAVAIGTGGPFGAEGPIIVTGGSLGSLVGQVVPVTPSERKILLASGAAAGMAATFGAPLASVVLAFELLLFEFSTRALIPVVVSSTIAAGIHSVVFGPGPLFQVPPHDYAGLSQLPFYALLGLACGLLATVVSKGLFVFEDLFRRLPVGEFWHPIVGAVGFASVGLLVPRALGTGYESIGDILAGRFAVGTLAALLVAKLLAWWVALASGTSGGTLAPILLIAGAFGGLLGAGLDAAIPAIPLATGAFAVVAMAATFGAATRATFASIVFVFELTQDYQVILPLLLAGVLADLVTTRFLEDSLMTEKLTRRGLRVSGDYEVDVLRTTLVRRVMSTDVQTLKDSLTLEEARRRFEDGAHSAYPLVDDQGRCVGIASRTDLLQSSTEDPGRPLSHVASRDVVVVQPDETVLAALQRILEEGVEHLPVVDHSERLVGICTRTDVLKARRWQLEHERSQGDGIPVPRLLRRVRGGSEPGPS